MSEYRLGSPRACKQVCNCEWTNETTTLENPLMRITPSMHMIDMYSYRIYYLIP